MTRHTLPLGKAKEQGEMPLSILSTIPLIKLGMGMGMGWGWDGDGLGMGSGTSPCFRVFLRGGV